MSNYFAPTQHPETGIVENAQWLDDHFGRHQYGVRFPDGKVFPADQIQYVDVNGTDAQCDTTTTTIYDWQGKPTDS